MRFEVCLVAHLFNIFDPVSKINELYSFLLTKVNKMQYVKGSWTSFCLCRIKIKKYYIEPVSAQVNNGNPNQSGSDPVTYFNGVGYVIEKEAVIIING
jgi:hypothetical protein